MEEGEGRIEVFLPPLVCFSFFKTESHFVALPGLELTETCLPLLCKYWD